MSLVSGFTLVCNGVKFEYPFQESLRSLAKICDEIVVNVGISDDGTLDLVRNVAGEFPHKKWVIFESHWPLEDPEKRKGGIILSEQTNLALDKCTRDWCLYLQADEVLHEEDTKILFQDLARADSTLDVEALVFQYRHLYGSFDIEQYSRSAYRREVRAIRRASGLRSVGDAQSFLHIDGRKPVGLLTKARIFHYGWVRTPDAMKQKTFFMDSLYHAQSPVGQSTATGESYKYRRFIGLRRFNETHPRVMQDRIAQKNWRWDFENSVWVFSAKDVLKWILDRFEGFTGVRLFEYKRYRLKRLDPKR